MQLRSALEECAWIETRGGVAIAAPQLAFVDYGRPAVVYGRRGGDEAPRVARGAILGAGVLQRRTGGGAVYVGPWMLGFHLALPPDHPVAALGVIASLRAFGELLMAALADAGAAAALADAEAFDAHAARVRAAGLDWACFAGLSHGELIDAFGRKLLGTCQWRGKWGLVLSGGLLLGRTPWEEFEYVHHGMRPHRSGMRDLASDGLDGPFDPIIFRRAIACRVAGGWAD